MADQKIKFRIKQDGNVELDVEGATGASCDDLTRPFEEALGTVDSKNAKPEFYVELEGEKVYDYEG